MSKKRQKSGKKRPIFIDHPVFRPQYLNIFSVALFRYWATACSLCREGNNTPTTQTNASSNSIKSCQFDRYKHDDVVACVLCVLCSACAQKPHTQQTALFNFKNVLNTCKKLFNFFFFPSMLCSIHRARSEQLFLFCFNLIATSRSALNCFFRFIFNPKIRFFICFNDKCL